MEEMDVEDLSDLRLSQLVVAYNQAQDLLGRGPENHIRGFKSGDAAVSSVSSIRDRLRKMHGHAVLRIEGDAVSWSVRAPPRPDEPRPRVSSAHDARVSTTSLSTMRRLALLVTSNPKRPRTRAHEIFQIYFSLDPSRMTGEEFIRRMVDAGYSRRLALSTLHWDIRHGYVALEAPHARSPDDRE